MDRLNRLLNQAQGLLRRLRPGRQYINSPITGRRIVVGGQAYRRVLRNFDIVNGQFVPRGILYENYVNNELQGVDNEHLVRDILKRNNIRGSIRVYYRVPEYNFGTYEDYDVPDGSINSWWNNNNYYQDWLYESNETIFAHNNFEGKIIIVKENFVEPRQFQQMFLDGITHCVLTPIKNYFENKLENNTADNHRQALEKKIRQTDNFIEKYKNGIPANEIKNVSETLNVNIDIVDVSRNTIVSEKTKGRQYNSFKFINTRINHVEQYTDISFDKLTKIDKKKYNELRKTLDENNEFYTYTDNEIHTTNGWYRIFDEDDEKVEEWEKELNLDTLEYFCDPELSEFVRKACHYGACIDYTKNPFEDMKNMKHTDHKTSYFRFEENPYYIKYGFPTAPKVYSHIPEDFKWWKYPGFYLIDEINFDNVKNPNTKKHLNKLNIYKKRDVFSVPELKYMKDIGITFKVKIGAFSYTKREIKNVEELLMIGGFIDENGKKHYGDKYKKWAGKQAMIVLDKKITFKADKEMAEHIAFEYGKDRIKYFEGTKEMSIYTRKKKLLHRSHISAYILSYSRIQILQQLFKIPFENVKRVQLDGIYYTECEFEQILTFQDKKVEYRKNIGCESYISSYDGLEWKPGNWHESHLYRICIFAGEGGAGKTHFALTNRAYNDPVYSPPTHKLREEKVNELGLTNTCCWNTLLCEGTKGHTGQKRVIIMDEITQLSLEREIHLFELYPNAKIILCGDLKRIDDKTIIFQLPNYTGDQFDSSNIPIFEFKRNEYSRCKDEKLYEIQQELRRMIIENKPKNEINKYLVEQLKDRKATIDNYTINDYILTGTHERIKKWTEDATKCGIPNKWLITNTCSKYNTGTVFIQKKKPNSTSELRHAFTVHQTQGLTVESNLFIDPMKLFDPRMAYTAISRAKILNQIYLIS